MRISHEGIELSRLQKVETLRDWPHALDRLYVCSSDASNGSNCGSCEKCVRTRVHLLVAGVLADAGAFAGADVGEAEIRAVQLRSEYARICFEESLPGLRRLGRDDLVLAVERVIGDYVQSQRASGRSAQAGLLRRVARKLKNAFPH